MEVTWKRIKATDPLYVDISPLPPELQRAILILIQEATSTLITKETP